MCRPYDSPIITVEELLDFSEKHFAEIKSYLIKKEEIDQLRMKIAFNAETISGTRNYHRFIPISNNIIGCKIISHHEKNAIAFNLTEKIAYSWSTNTYVTFAFGNAWHLGFISQTSWSSNFNFKPGCEK